MIGILVIWICLEFGASEFGFLTSQFVSDFVLRVFMRCASGLEGRNYINAAKIGLNR